MKIIIELDHAFNRHDAEDRVKELNDNPSIHTSHIDDCGSCDKKC